MRMEWKEWKKRKKLRAKEKDGESNRNEKMT